MLDRKNSSILNLFNICGFFYAHKFSVYDLNIFRLYFSEDHQQVGNDDDKLTTSLFCHFHEVALHLVERPAMNPNSLALFDVDFIFLIVDLTDFVEVDLFLRLLSYLDKVGHFFIGYGQIDEFVATFPCDKLEVVIIIVFEINNLLMACIHKHKTMDDRYHANDFLAVDGAKDFLLGYEMRQAVLFIGEPLFGSTLVLVGPHDIPLWLILNQSIFHTFLICVFGERTYSWFIPMCVSVCISITFLVFQLQ